MKIKLSKTWIVIIIIVLLIVGYYISKSVFKSPTEGLATEKVQKGEVSQEISETGSVKATEEINLGFKSVGKVARIDVVVGDSVKRGDILAELDPGQASAQLQSYKSALDNAQSQYDKLINGLTVADLKIYQDAVSTAQQNLNHSYDGALNTLNSAYSGIYGSYVLATSIKDTYFPTTDTEGIAVSNAKSDISASMQDAKVYLDLAAKSPSNADLDSTVLRMLAALKSVFDDVRTMREQCNQDIYYYQVTDADKTLLDTQKTTVNTALTNVTTLQQSIASYKLVLQKAQDDLSSKSASPRPEDIDAERAQVQQAQANVNLYQSQLNDIYLASPIDGVITKINIKKGQVAPVSQTAISLLSSEPFQIKVDIYEQDIVNVKVGDDVKIDLVPFPKEMFNGKVLSIDPAETIVDNVVYYEVTVEFPDQPDGIKSGMTADITIEANKKENVVRVSKNAIAQIDGAETVQVFRNGKIENAIITTGLEGNDYYEVTSGLNEGDIIIMGKQ